MKMPSIRNMKSIKNKFAFPVILFTVVLLILSNLYTIQKNKIQYYSNLREKAIYTAESGAATLNDLLWNFNIEGVKACGTSLLEDENVGYIEIKNSEDKEVFKYIKSDDIYANSNWIYVDKIIVKDNQKIGYLKIGVTQYYEQVAVKKDIMNASIEILVMSIILWIMIITISSYVTKPIKKLKACAEEIASGNLKININVESQDEIGQFANTFNFMISKLISTYNELSEVYDNLAATEEELRAQYEELQYNEEALRSSDERYRLALDGANDAIWEWNLVTWEYFASDKLYEMTGHNLNKSIDLRGFNEFIHTDDIPIVKKDFYNHINNITPIYQSEYRIKKIDGTYIWISSRGKALRDSEGKAIKFAGSISDITDKKISEDKVKFIAFHDSLTKLHNRAFFMEKLNEEIKLANDKNAEGAVFFIDLDNFKNINDTMGHDYGDKLLIYLATKLEKLIDGNDTICRLGGDEFLLIHPYEEPLEVVEYANNLLTLFNSIFEVDNKQMYITASVGVALYPKDGSDASSILKNADFAMYKAKELGKNRYALYDGLMYLQLERKTSIDRILRSSIKNNELSIHYQLQYDAQKNEIFGFEALLRLNSKELGFISPAEFIPIAEESGFITKLGQWVLNEACMQGVKWLEAGYKFKSISINVSSVDVHQPDFLENIKGILQNTKINPNIVELEITETALMQSFDFSIDILNELMDMGIRIALDDFGTGYSSLNYLRKIPIATLKIDKSFIDNITSSTKEESIINNIIQMAHSMDLKVVAEGVETKDQLSILKERGCDYIQGYYFSKPLPANEVEKLLSNGYV